MMMYHIVMGFLCALSNSVLNIPTERLHISTVEIEHPSRGELSNRTAGVEHTENVDMHRILRCKYLQRCHLYDKLP